MTPEQLAARWLADVSRMTCNFDTTDGSEIPPITLLHETETLAAIAHHLAPGDDLVERLETKAAMIALGEKIAWGSDTAIMQEAAARLSALTAQVAELQTWQSDMKGHIAHADAYHNVSMQNLARAESAEAEAATLRDRLARMETERDELREANASYQSALTSHGIDGSEGSKQ